MHLLLKVFLAIKFIIVKKTLIMKASASSTPGNSRPSVAIMNRLAGRVAAGILDWWSTTRLKIGQIPGRQHVAPENFKPFLSHVFMTDVEPGPEFRFRLHGTYMVNLWGRDFTGKLIGPETFGTRWRDVHECYQRTIRSNNPIATQEVVRHSAGFDIEVEVIHLPLAKNGIDVDMVIGTVERTDHRWSKGLMPPEGTAIEWSVRSAVNPTESE